MYKSFATYIFCYGVWTVEWGQYGVFEVWDIILGKGTTNQIESGNAFKNNFLKRKLPVGEKPGQIPRKNEAEPLDNSF